MLKAFFKGAGAGKKQTVSARLVVPVPVYL